MMPHFYHDQLPDAVELRVKEFVQGTTVTLPISTAKQYCKHFNVPVFKGKGAPETVGIWDLLILCSRVTGVVTVPLQCELRFIALCGTGTAMGKRVACHQTRDMFIRRLML